MSNKAKYPVFILVGCLLGLGLQAAEDARSYFDRGIEASYTRDIPKEIENFKKSIELCKKNISRKYPLLIAAYEGLATAYMHKNELAQSIAVLREALPYVDKYYSQDYRRQIEFYDSLSLYLYRNGEYSKCMEMERRIVGLRELLLNNQVKTVSRSYKRLADICRQLQKPALAKAYLKKATYYENCQITLKDGGEADRQPGPTQKRRLTPPKSK